MNIFQAFTIYVISLLTSRTSQGQSYLKNVKEFICEAEGMIIFLIIIRGIERQ